MFKIKQLLKSFLPFTYDNAEVDELYDLFVFILNISKHAFTTDLSKPLKSVHSVASVSLRFCALKRSVQ